MENARSMVTKRFTHHNHSVPRNQIKREEHLELLSNPRVVVKLQTSSVAVVS